MQKFTQPVQVPSVTACYSTIYHRLSMIISSYAGIEGTFSATGATVIIQSEHSYVFEVSFDLSREKGKICILMVYKQRKLH